MIKTSEKFREELSKPFRQGIANEIVLYTNMDLDVVDNPLFEIEENVGSPSDIICEKSATEEVFLSSMPFNDFCSFEPNTYDTTNPKKLFREYRQDEDYSAYSKQYNTGIVSANRYTTAGTESNPFFTKTVKAIDLEDYNISGLTIHFGTDSTIFPTDFIIECFDVSGTRTFRQEYSGNTSLSCAIKQKIKFYKIKITVLKMNRKDVKLRISRVIFGLELVLRDEIISTQTKKSGHPISTELPDNSLTVNIWDSENLFDPQNPQGIYFSLLGNERVESYYTYGNERVLIGSYRLDGRPTVENHNVTLKCKSAFWQQIAACNSGDVQGEVETPTQYANRCVALATGGRYVDYFSGEFTVARHYELVKDSVQNIILLFANLSLFQFQESPDGRVTVKVLLDCRTDKGHEVNEYADKSKSFNLDDTLICGEIKLDTTIGLAKSYKIAYYMDDVQNWYKEPADVENPDIVIDNKLNRGSPDAAEHLVKPRLDWWVLGSHKYTIPYMADPTIEVGDLVNFTDKYGKVIYGFVSEVNISYPSSPSSDNIVIYTTDKVK